MDRRDALGLLGFGAVLGAWRRLGGGEPVPAEGDSAERYARATRGLGPLKIARVRAIVTAPSARVAQVVVKVETSEPGLYGLGCATFHQRSLLVAEAVEKYLDPFARGRDADAIEDMWQTAYTSSYWRNGPVLNSALSGLDQALWDLKGKRAGMPVYQLLGGKSRAVVPCYAHAGGRTFEEVEESVRRLAARGFRHVRIQLGGYGSPHLSGAPLFRAAGYGLPSDQHMDPGPYLRAIPRLFEHVRAKCGEEIELLHDIHERVPPVDAIRLVKDLAPYRPFFVEDPFSPEDIGYFRILRGQTSVPIAMGELFNSPHEWVGLISERLIDFIRVHISQVGGLTVARKIAALAEWFGVRTAWHGPLDVSPVGHAANVHLDLAVHNFGIQECVDFDGPMLKVFPGAPTVKGGVFLPSESPGLGVDVDEEAAKRHPPPERPANWDPVRRSDGTSARP
ncbi:MAG: enolase C-terminal domain-like protein [Planctomycetota bacterium]